VSKQKCPEQCYRHRVLARVEGEDASITLLSPAMERIAPSSIYAAVTSTICYLRIQPVQKKSWKRGKNRKRPRLSAAAM
jgi:hypothetical protein